MIKTALTINISQSDAQSVSYLANGTHLGLLSSAGQNIHVQASHRPVQMVTGIKAIEPESGSRLAHQRQQINAWQSMFPLLAHRGASALNSLLTQYHLLPHLLICLDENRLQAWIGSEHAFYLLRQGEVRLLHPVPPRDADLPESFLDQHQYYSLQLFLDDFFFIIPPDLLPYFSAGEFAEQLLGLRQLPAKMSDLIATARQRGYEQETTWLALQVQRLEEEQNPEGRSGGALHAFGSFLNRLGSPSGQEHRSDSATDAIPANGADLTGDEERLRGRRKPGSTVNPAVKWLGMAVILIAAVIAIILLTGKKPPETEPSNTTSATTVSTTTVETTTEATTLATTTETTTEATTTTEPEIILVVHVSRLNLRAEASKSSDLLAKLDTGAKLVQLEEPADKWVKVRTEEGLVGYVYASYVSPADEP